MSDQPSLFEQLAADPDRRIHAEPQRTWCRLDEECITLWRQHGIPADLTTVEQACLMLFALHAEYRALATDLGATP